MYNVYLDDVRETPEGFVRVYTAQECIKFLQDHNGEIEVLSLDHDLGYCKDTGYTVCCWMEEEANTNDSFILPNHILVHSANPVGSRRMQVVIDLLMDRARH